MVVRVDRVTKIMKETCNTTKLITDYPIGSDKKVIREVMHDDDNFEEHENHKFFPDFAQLGQERT